MTIIRRGDRPQDHYTSIHNDWLRDPRTSYKAKGILAAICSHREDYELTVEQLIRETKDGPAAVYTGLKELVEVGYLKMTRARDERGRMGETVFELCDPPPLEKQVRPTSRKSRPGPDQEKQESTTPRFSTRGEPTRGKSKTKKNKGLEDHRENTTSPPRPVDPSPAVAGGWEEVEDGSPDENQTALAATTLDAILERALTDPRRAPRGRHRAELVRLIAGVAAAGWHPLDVGVAVGGSLDDAQSVFGVLRHRLAELGPPPARGVAGAGAKRGRVEWCRECSDPDGRRVVLEDGRDGGRCPRCHPGVVSHAVKD